MLLSLLPLHPGPSASGPWASSWLKELMLPGTCAKCLDLGPIWPQVICKPNLILQIANCKEIFGSLADAGTGTSVQRSSPSDACSHQAICHPTGAARIPLRESRHASSGCGTKHSIWEVLIGKVGCKAVGWRFMKVGFLCGLICQVLQRPPGR